MPKIISNTERTIIFALLKSHVYRGDNKRPMMLSIIIIIVTRERI